LSPENVRANVAADTAREFVEAARAALAAAGFQDEGPGP